MPFPRPRLLSWLLTGLLVAQGTGVTLGHHGGRPIGSLFTCDRPGVTPPRCTSVASDLRHRIFLDPSLPQGLASSLRDTMAEDYDPTDFTMIEAPALTPTTDAVAMAADYGDNGAAAWVYCPPDAPQGFNPRGDRWCRMQQIHFNTNARFSIFFDDDPSRDHVACHELGHTIGLRHWGNPPDTEGPAAETCMNGDTPNGPTVLHQIDRDHINAYGYRTLWPPSRVRLAQADPAQLAGISDNALQLEQFGSLAAMRDASDAVVRGTVDAVESGRIFGTAAAPFHYASATIRVGEVIAGSVPSSGELTLEIPLFDGPASLREIQAALGGAEAIFFLRSKAESARSAGMSPDEQRADAGYYRLLTFNALTWTDAGLTEVGTDASAALAQLRGHSLDDTIRLIRAAD